MGKQALEADRGQFFFLDPDELVLIVDPKHPLYDPRVHLPISEQFIRNLDTFGVKKIVKGRKNGKLDNGRPRVEVVDGRQRIKGAREVNARRRQEGREPLLVKVELERGSDAEMDTLMVLSNENRRDDDLVTKAGKAQRLIGQLGLAKTALIFGVEGKTVENWLKLLDLGDDVQAQVRAGTLSPAAALPLVDLSRSEQTAAVAQLTAGGVVPTASAAKTAVAKTGGAAGSKYVASERCKAARTKLLDVAARYEREEAKLDDLKEAAKEYGAAKRATSRKKKSGKAKFAGVTA